MPASTEKRCDLRCDRLRRVGRGEALDNVALTIDEEFREIPLDRLGAEDARSSRFQMLVDGMREEPLTSTFS